MLSTELPIMHDVYQGKTSSPAEIKEIKEMFNSGYVISFISFVIIDKQKHYDRKRDNLSDSRSNI